MKFPKAIFSFILSIPIVLSILVSPALAYPSDAIKYQIDTWYNFLKNPLEGMDWSAKELWSKLVSVEAYKGYADEVKEKLGTTQVGTKYFYLAVPVTEIRSSYFTISEQKLGIPGFARGIREPSGISSTFDIAFRGTFSPPVSGLYVSVPVVISPYKVERVRDYFYFRNTSDTSSPHLSPSDGVCGVAAVVEYYQHKVDLKEFSLSCSLVLRVYPDSYSLPTFTAPIGGNNSRVGNLGNANYGYYVGKDLKVVKDTKIVNEGDKTWYNPVTNTINNFNDFTYDYSDRSYHLTLVTNEGDTTTTTKTTIIYGDEYITIKEGDTTTNIYYITEVVDGGTTDPKPDPDPGTGGGSNTDGDKESIWEKIGNFLGSVLKGIVDLVTGVLGKILDALTSLVTMVVDKLGAVLDALFGIFAEIPELFAGFTAFLVAIFPFLPPIVFTIIEFGLIAVVFVALIKLIFFR